jgi:site-specific recombinase
MAGNISLGVFLGLFPVVFKFFGLPLDIRHVTLSTGMLASAAMSIGTEVFSSWDFYLCCLGVVAIGICNIAGAFLCSMLVALRARNVKAPQRSKIYRLFWKRIFERPSQLFWV